MQRTNKFGRIGLMLLGLLLSLSGYTDQAREFNGYVIHYNAVTTDFLRPEVAQTHGIVRSRNRVLLNVSVQVKTEGTVGRPIRAKVSASATNLNGQLKTIAMREVRDGDAIYYLGELPVADKEILDFTAKVTPEGDETRTYTIEFRKQFFTS